MSIEKAHDKMQQTKEVQFAYLQVYSTAGAFGGLNEPDALVAAFAQMDASNGPIAVALTDSFSLRGVAEWAALLADNPRIVPLIGAEVGLKFPNSFNLPLGLILLATSEGGYQNLCRLISLGLENASTRPLTATVELEDLRRYHEGLIAIAPYYGGPITAGMPGGKGVTEAKNRAITLRDAFGPDNFFLGVPPDLTTPLPAPDPEGQETHLDASIKLNSALNKIAREQKIGLLVTGETRYVEAVQAGDYAALRNRLGRALAEQFQPSQLQQKVDWLYSLAAGHPVANLQIQPPTTLTNRYTEADWPGAIANNIKVANRCAAFHLSNTSVAAQAELAQHCQTEISRRYAGEGSEKLPDEVQTRGWLESELAAIADLNLAPALLAAARLFQQANPSQVLMARGVGGSLVAYLLGLTERPPVADAWQATSYGRFETYGSHRPLRIETGRDGRERLIAALNAPNFEPAEWVAAPVASLSSEAGALPYAHPRLTVLSLNKLPLAQLVPLQPAQIDSTGLTRLAAQVGAIPPAHVSVLEIRQSAALARLQLTLDVVNAWKQQHGQPPLEVRHLPHPAENDYDTPHEFERALIRERLNFLRVTHPAAYYGATLSLVDPEQRPAHAHAARQNDLQILPPAINHSHADFVMLDENTLRVGLATLLGHALANQLLDVRGPHFAGIDDFAYKSELDAAQLSKLIWSGALDEFGERPALALLVPQIIQTSKRFRELQNRSNNNVFLPLADSDNGQLSLFSMLDVAESSALPVQDEPPPLQLPKDAPKLSILERLRRQRDALGYFTSEHPLWNLQPVPHSDASRTDFTPLAALASISNGAGNGANQSLRLAGLVVGLRRLPLADANGKGQELTILKLEDWDGRAEILIPPGVLEVSGLESLGEGQAVAALVRTDAWQPGLVPLLVAEALAAYSAQADLFGSVSDDDKFDIEAELEKFKQEALASAVAEMEAASFEPIPLPNAPPPEDWSTEFFEAVGAAPLPTKPMATSIAQIGAANAKRDAGKAGSKGGKEVTKPARPLQKRVNIYLPTLEDEDAEEEFSRQVSELLYRHPGENQVVLYAPQEDGSWQRFESTTKNVTIGPAFEQAARQLLGEKGFVVEEY